MITRAAPYTHSMRASRPFQQHQVHRTLQRVTQVGPGWRLRYLPRWWWEITTNITNQPFFSFVDCDTTADTFTSGGYRHHKRAKWDRELDCTVLLQYRHCNQNGPFT